MNHIIDPTYFWDAIEEFSFNYTIYRKNKADTIDDYGRAIPNYKKDVIRGSFQTQGSSKNRSTRGNTQSEQAEFYCKSLYRIKEDDVVVRNNQYYICTGTHNYDEWGVRQASLKMTSLEEVRDFNEWMKFQTGGIIV